jgi:hypothetical protein
MVHDLAAQGEPANQGDEEVGEDGEEDEICHAVILIENYASRFWEG